VKLFGKLGLTLLTVLFASAVHATPRLDIDVDTTLGGFQSGRVVKVGTIFEVEIHISDVSGLFAYDIDVDHDGGILDATAVTEGSFLPSGGTTAFFSDDSANPVNAAATLLGLVPGVSGSGTLFTIEYIALATGISSLQFSLVDLVDDQLNAILVDASGGRIVVQAAPLPSTLLMLGVGLAAIAGLRRRTH
jgi:hypothetical protein